MSQLKSQLHEKDKHIKTTRIFAFLFFIIILVLAGVIYTFPSRLTIYNPPDLRAGANELGGKFLNQQFMHFLIKFSSK